MTTKHQQATAFLSNIDEDWAKLIATVGPCDFQAKEQREPFEALIRAVAYQQLTAKVGDAILAKLISHFNSSAQNQFPTALQIIESSFDDLRQCGFSRRKIETLKLIAEGTINGLVPSGLEASRMTDEALIERLIQLKGIGRWTVEMMLMFTLARMDILPADDFGIAQGYRRLKKLASAPSRKMLTEIAKAWSPHRTVASWYLWRVPREW